MLSIKARFDVLSCLTSSTSSSINLGSFSKLSLWLFLRIGLAHHLFTVSNGVGMTYSGLCPSSHVHKCPSPRAWQAPQGSERSHLSFRRRQEWQLKIFLSLTFFWWEDGCEGGNEGCMLPLSVVTDDARSPPTSRPPSWGGAI